MRILIVHNRYQLRGGEDTVFEAESALLEAAGHQVERVEFDNSSISGFAAKIGAATSGLYNHRSSALVTEAIARVRPEVLHVHNFFPTASPSVFYAAHRHRVATIWTLHNYRVTCVNGLLLRDDRPCELCVGGSGFAGIVHRCYRRSRVGSGVASAIHRGHAAIGTWQTKIDRFIALNDFARRKFISAGLPPAKLVVKPNFAPEPAVAWSGRPRGGAVFAGRLSREKGVDTLIAGWEHVQVPLTIIGTGPEEQHLRSLAPPNVTFLGAQPKEKVIDAMAGAAAVLVPSRWYENFPMTVVEAFSVGTPVIASAIGALREIISDQSNGLLFRVEDPESLARTVNAAFAHPTCLSELGAAARRTYEEKLSPVPSLRALETIYHEALQERRSA